MQRLVVLVLALGALGCAMRVRGAVRDAQNGRPIPNAYVSSDCYPNAVSTDANGRFEVLFRLYGPQKPFFDKKWVLPDIERIAAQ